jgi:UDP-glucose 4-epimerase
MRYFIVGGAGFIGSHLVDRLLSFLATEKVTVYDNFSSGREWHCKQHVTNPRFMVMRADVKDQKLLAACMRGHDTVIHLASNPDISCAATEPDIDFREGTCLTNNVLEAMRLANASTIIYASGSGVYGDLGDKEADENHGPLVPISTYGASKLAGEALISSYCHMFGFTGRVFRFANVVGPRQTHGVGLDFLRQLLEHPTFLRILGDGTQSKPYIHVDDVVSAILLVFLNDTSSFSVYNVATSDHVMVKEIALMAGECMALKDVKFEYTGGNRGWKGDIPVVRMNSDRIRGMGWNCRVGSKEALRKSMVEILKDLRSEAR